MTSETDNTRDGLIERVIQYVMEKLPDDESPLIKDFLKAYYMRVSPDDLGSRSILDLYGAVVSHWHFLYQRLPGEIKVRVYNPNQEEHGWQSPHTVIEISTGNKPFIIDSVRLALTREGYNIHLLIHLSGIRFQRDVAGNIIAMSTNANDKSQDFVGETPIYIEIDRQSDIDTLNKIKAIVNEVINDVDIIVNDWAPMREQALTCIKLLQREAEAAASEELSEVITFMQWIADDNFTFLAFARYNFIYKEDNSTLEYIPDTALGLFTKKSRQQSVYSLKDMATTARQTYLSKQRLMIGKTNVMSTIHRPTYEDFVSVKFFDANNRLVEEWRFVGLYTAVAYNSLPKDIPYIRKKIEKIFTIAGFSQNTHDGKALFNILDTLPRDDLFHATAQELHDLAIGVLYLQERQKISLFVRKDIYGQYFSCLVYVPRDRFNSSLRQKMQKILREELGGYSVDFSTKFSESILARIHFIVRIDPLVGTKYSVNAIENKLIESARTWNDDLQDALHESFGEEKANELMRNYSEAFPAGYCESFTARSAVIDIEHIERLLGDPGVGLAMSLYRPIEDKESSCRFKLFRLDKPFPLSDVVPMLENMGLRVISERPYHIRRGGNGDDKLWVNDYRMLQPFGQNLSPELVKNIFQEAFAAMWNGWVENDRFNRLVLSAMLTWREVSIIRAYFKYLWQTGMVFSQNSVEDALYNNSQLAKKLVTYFLKRFALASDKNEVVTNSEVVDDARVSSNDDNATDNKTELEIYKASILQDLEEVKSLNEDRIIRKFLSAIDATIRTNYFQLGADDKPKSYISFKIISSKIPDLPKPHPLYEIFVYSPRMEGIHLRAAKVARGGIRWSDRHEDFRTEVLGLMKAQQVKNAVIVPLGAKGGFVVKTNMSTASRDEFLQEGVECYKILIQGLLDLTDNRAGDTIIPPENVVRYDDDDPYLVVAADKGTATFSDIANEISAKYKFWLGDAFASGGSAGYDHKKMGITARGAWESVKMHFLRLGIDTQTTPFTVVGIGDLAGDVFGNGMLMSPYIKLVAAFNHLHIFIDPDPNPELSFKERKRMFDLPRSNWTDYNPKYISKGGGVFLRTEKSIKLTPEIKALFGLDTEQIVPNDLIKTILKAKVDLLWNGGIGTFVRSSSESNQSVGDRTNDGIRIKATQLRCKVVAEGGNLGFTQLARIEYAQRGGLINTDAIDNSGGVNCSDNEVNIKVLLADVVSAGDLTIKQRNLLLAEMQDEVGEIVLKNNRQQNEAITVAESQAASSLEMHHRLMKTLEKIANLDRNLEFLPDKEEIINRNSAKKGLTRPEIAILLAYSKILLKKNLLDSDALEDPYVLKELALAFPSQLRERYKNYMANHRLKREIISTQVSNSIIDEMGINFVSRLHDETGAYTSQIVCAYMVAREVFKANKVRAEIEYLGTRVESKLQLNMMQELNRLIRRATRWVLRNRRGGLDITNTISCFAPKVREIQENIMDFLIGSDLIEYQENTSALVEAKVPIELASMVSSFPAMFSALDISEASMQEDLPVLEIAKVYFAVGARLELIWFRELIKKQPISDNWEALARAAFRDDIDRQQCLLTVSILKTKRDKMKDLQTHVTNWLDSHQLLLSRWEYFVAELKATTPEFTMFAVALRELLDLSHGLYVPVAASASTTTIPRQAGDGI